jgi:hypothetical protein
VGTGRLAQHRVAGLPLPDGRDGAFLAGLIDAEGSFVISANNGRQNWRCALKLAMRDDDAPVLLALQRSTGLGRLTRVRARGNSKPQAAWNIVSRAECGRLIEILERHPLRSRKRFEFDVWRRAHQVLEVGPADRLPLLAHDLLSLRRYGNTAARERPALDSEDFLPYFGGFFTGEGHLQLTRTSCRAVVKLREDDRPLLEALAARTGIGRVYGQPAGATSGPAAAWIVYRQQELQSAVRLLDAAGLRGRKRLEFEAWARGALEFANARGQRRRRDQSLVDDACACLAEARAYRSPPAIQPPSLANEYFAETCLSALRKTAAAVDGPLTSTAYMELRRANPHWPDRNAIVSTFGSWANALTLADLDDRISPHAQARRRRQSREPDESRRRANRERVLAGVRECTRTIGASPTVSQYLEWRASASPPPPALATTYRLFPDGWESVLRAADAPS